MVHYWCAVGIITIAIIAIGFVVGILLTIRRPYDGVYSRIVENFRLSITYSAYIVFIVFIVFSLIYAASARLVRTDSIPNINMSSEKLAQISFEGKSIYILLDDNSVQYCSVDNNNVLSYHNVPLKDSKVHYGNGDSRVVISEGVLKTHWQWWIIYAAKSEEKITTYDFYIPSKKYINTSYEGWISSE